MGCLGTLFDVIVTYVEPQQLRHLSLSKFVKPQMLRLSNFFFLYCIYHFHFVGAVEEVLVISAQSALHFLDTR